MRIDRTLPLKLLWAAYGVMWAGGLLRLPDTGWAGPLFLLIAGLIALLSEPTGWRALLVAAAVGFAFECIGVRTGFPFGSYSYTGRLGPLLWHVPLVISCAWMVVFAFARQVTANPWIGAALMTATDLVIDPVASRVLGYWHWRVPGVYFGVPVANFEGWFLVSLVIFFIARDPAEKNLSHRILGASILLFFIART